MTLLNKYERKVCEAIGVTAAQYPNAALALDLVARLARLRSARPGWSLEWDAEWFAHTEKVRVATLSRYDDEGGN